MTRNTQNFPKRLQLQSGNTKKQKAYLINMNSVCFLIFIEKLFLNELSNNYSMQY